MRPPRRAAHSCVRSYWLTAQTPPSGTRRDSLPWTWSRYASSDLRDSTTKCFVVSFHLVSSWSLIFFLLPLSFPLLLLRPRQADDVRALLTAAMPPSALPGCYKPQIISVTASAAPTVAIVPPRLFPSLPSSSSSSSSSAHDGTTAAAVAAAAAAPTVSDASDSLPPPPNIAQATLSACAFPETAPLQKDEGENVRQCLSNMEGEGLMSCVLAWTANSDFPLN